MSIISLIAAIDECSGLGCHNKLLCHLPADLKHFKQLTTGKPIIMGRKTFMSIGRALPGRTNIVLSKQALLINDVIVATSLTQALQCVLDAPEVMIIGGARVFGEALPLAQRLYLTIIHHKFVADVFFPTLDLSEWSLYDETHVESDENNQYSMTFLHYERNKIN